MAAKQNGIALISRKESSLSLLQSAREQLAHVRTIDDAKQIRDKAEAVRHYLKVSGEGLAAQNEAAAVKVLAERAGGKLLAKMELHGGDRGNQHAGGKVASCNLAALGIKKTQSHRWQLMAAVPQKQFDEHLEWCLFGDRELTSSAIATLGKKHKAKTSTELDAPAEGVFTSLGDIAKSGLRFKAIYADPPWRYGNQATRASTDNHYETMAVEDIAAMPVSELAEDSALLFLWTTNGFLFESKAVIDAWGFEFKSSMVWVKPQIGIGNYVRNSHEFLLIASRGGMRTTDAGKSQVSWIQADRGKHSAKPQVFRKAVEELSEPNRLELFGRSKADGWVVFGNQVETRTLLRGVSGGVSSVQATGD